MEAIINSTLHIPITNYDYRIEYDDTVMYHELVLTLSQDTNNYATFVNYMGTIIANCQVVDNNTVITVPTALNLQFKHFSLSIKKENNDLIIEPILIGEGVS